MFRLTNKPAGRWRWARRPDPAGADTAETPPRTSTEPVELTIAPDDPLLTYLTGARGAVRVDALELASPALEALRAEGTRLVVPLVSQGELVGMLRLGPRRSEQDYSQDDHNLLEDLAAHAAPAVRLAQLVREQQAELRQRERIEQELEVARLIQQQFLPRELPGLPGWHVAAHYQPARAVGGDFYDFIDLPGGRVGIVVGDVAGKGVPAALVMATTHSLLRAEAPRLVAPADVLRRVNELLVGEMPPYMFVTCLYAVLDPAAGWLRFANAGHNLPYLRGVTGVTELRATGMPLGLLPGMDYEEREATLEPGERLLLHSDGLAEAHAPHDNEMFGLPRLATLCAAPGSGEALIDRLLVALAGFTGPDWEQEDDITLVTLERIGALRQGAAASGPHTLDEFDIPSQTGIERTAADRVAKAVAPLGLPDARLERLRTATAEAVMNAAEHGNRNRAELPVGVRVTASATTLEIAVSDQGGGRELPEPTEPDLDAKLAGEQSPRGWGLFLIRNMVDDLRVSGDEEHRTVHLVLHLHRDPPGDGGGEAADGGP